MLAPLIPPAGRPARPGRFESVVGVLAMTIAVAVVAAVHRMLTPDRWGSAVASVDSVERDSDLPRFAVPAGGRLPAGTAVPVRVGRYEVAELACRSWFDEAPAASGAPAGGPVVGQFPVVAGQRGRPRCMVSVSTRAQTRPGVWFTIQLVRIGSDGVVVEEYRPVRLRWSEPEPGD